MIFSLEVPYPNSQIFEPRQLLPVPRSLSLAEHFFSKPQLAINY